ncbi:MAG TPA: DUF4157 domain-containing protein [Longimicrobium sp.]|nr:DUF4157 domain-containing protein [Longimicrobium sp.]
MMLAHEPRRSPASPRPAPAPAPRRCACGGTIGPGGECEQCRRSRLAVQREASVPGPAVAPPVVHEVLASPGEPLDAGARASLAPRTRFSFSRVSVHPQRAGLSVNEPGDAHEREADRFAEQATGEAAPASPGPRMELEGVRVHTGPRAWAAADAVGARAFTVGSHIVFGRGEYAPGTRTGMRLLAHELAHVGQQGAGGSGVLQRSIRIVSPAGAPPNPPAGAAAGLTNAALAEQWIDRLCPSGNWSVDAGTGEVSSPDRATFCARRARRGHDHWRSSGTPTSCDCLCQLTAAGSKDIRLHVANSFNVGAAAVSVTAAGEGATVYPAAGRPEYNVGVSGNEMVGIPGAGDTAPLAGANPTQTLRDPPWIIFGHEVCGHARLQTAPMGPTRWQHAQTAEGDRGAVDIENRIRREHSTLADNFGIRRGDFRDAAGVTHDGSRYTVRAGETLSGIARRCGLTNAQILTHVFRENGAAITAATINRVNAGERLLIEGIFWHEVISGETMTSIAQIWNVPLASLIRANPQIADPNLIRPGNRLLVPAT